MERREMSTQLMYDQYTMIKKYKNILSGDEKNFLKKQVLNNLHFPFYLNKSSMVDKKDYFPFLSHNILTRPEEGKKGDSRKNSPLHNYCTNLFNSISKRCKFEYKQLLRIAINFTFNNGVKASDIHLDHPYFHKQLLIYLHADDKNSFTLFYDKDGKKVIKKIRPEPNTGVISHTHPHSHLTPQKGYRVVLVYTFN